MTAPNVVFSIYLVYTCHMKCHSIPGIYLVYTFQMKLCAPPGCRIAIEMQQYTGIGLKGCLMFCRMWPRRRCHWASVSQPEGRAVARLGPRRQSRAAYAVEPPPPTPTAAAAGQSRRRRRRRRGRRWWGHAASADAHCRGGAGAPPPMTTRTKKRKSCRLDAESKRQ